MNIHAVSKLVRRPPSLWISTLRNMERGRDFMRSHYAPLREAIVAELQHPGTGEELLHAAWEQILGPLTPSQSSVHNRSFAAFHAFLDIFRPSIGRLLQSYLGGEYQPEPVEFCGHQLEGHFHLAVETPRGETKYVYLHASEWSPEQIDAFLELLVIIAEKRHGADRSAVWFFDLPAGEILKPRKTFRKTRKDLEKVVTLLEIVDSAVYGDDETA